MGSNGHAQKDRCCTSDTKAAKADHGSLSVRGITVFRGTCEAEQSHHAGGKRSEHDRNNGRGRETYQYTDKQAQTYPGE
ncbi:MAG TPA: hypothetical protein VGY94_03030 [Acidobacteriaceae bacterium]|nr:hypothetical protein [Acidobacteriaceae bacterium]